MSYSPLDPQRRTPRLSAEAREVARDGFLATLGGGAMLLIATVALVLAVVVGTAVYQHFAVGLENQRTQNVRQTNQYVTSQQVHLTTLYADYRDLDTQIAKYAPDPANAALVAGFRDQQRAILRGMRATTATIEPSQVPADVARLLAQNP